MADTLDYQALGSRIRKAREAMGLTQESFAELCSLSAAHIGHIERGTRIPSLDTLHTISRKLGIGIDALLFDSHVENVGLNDIAAAIQGKGKDKTARFMSMVRMLANHIDEI